MIITPPSGMLAIYSEAPIPTVAPAVRPIVPRGTLHVFPVRSVVRRTELIHGPPLAA